MKTPLRFCLVPLVMWGSSQVMAHGGEDHGDAPHPVVTNVAPRFEARSDLFELVGVAEGQDLVLFLDRLATNAPVVAGRIEIETGSFKGEALPAEGGVYRLAAPALQVPGVHALIITVEAEGEMDLLTAQFTSGANASSSTSAHAAPHGSDQGEGSFLTGKGGLGLAGLLGLLVAGLGLRKWITKRQGDSGKFTATPDVMKGRKA